MAKKKRPPQRSLRQALGKFIDLPQDTQERSVSKLGAPKIGTPKTGIPEIDTLKLIEVKDKYYKIPNDVNDVLVKFQSSSEQSIYNRLYRLSYGFHKNTCRVGLGSLSESCNISKNTAKKAVEGLCQKKHIRPLDTNQQGTLYRVFLPHEIDGIPRTGIPEIGTPKNGIPENNTRSVEKSGIPETGTPIPKQPIDNQKDTSISKSGIPETGSNKEHNKDIKKNTLSSRILVEKFYNLLNQTKISKQKRERALRQINQLVQENFSLKDIDFAIEWTVENKSGLHSFGIVAETIGEALAEKQKYLETQRERERAQKEKEEKQRKEKEKQDLDRKIQNIRDTLSQEELRKIHHQAESAVKTQTDAKKFGRDILVRLKENEIIRNLYLENSNE